MRENIDFFLVFSWNLAKTLDIGISEKSKSTQRKNQYFLSKPIFLKQSAHGAHRNTGGSHAVSAGPYPKRCTKTQYFRAAQRVENP